MAARVSASRKGDGASSMTFWFAALDGAFALAQMYDVATLVAQHLDLDMARLGDEFLDEDAVVAEGGFSPRPWRRGTRRGPPRRSKAMRIALAAAAGRRL